MKKQFPTLLVGGIMLAASLLVFMIILPAFWAMGLLCLVFLLLAEVVAFGGAYILQNAGGVDKTLLGAGGVSSLYLYLSISVVATLVFRLVPLLWPFTSLYLVIQISLLALLAVRLVTLQHFAAGAKEQQGALGEVNDLRGMVNSMQQAAAALPEGETKAALMKAGEEVLYTDLTMETPADRKLQAAVRQLRHACEQGDMEEAAELVAEVERLAAARESALLGAKHGGF